MLVFDWNRSGLSLCYLILSWCVSNVFCSVRFVVPRRFFVWFYLCWHSFCLAMCSFVFVVASFLYYCFHFLVVVVHMLSLFCIWWFVVVGCKLVRPVHPAQMGNTKQTEENTKRKKHSKTTCRMWSQRKPRWSQAPNVIWNLANIRRADLELSYRSRSTPNERTHKIAHWQAPTQTKLNNQCEQYV